LTTIPTLELMAFIKEYLLKESVDKIVLGLPVNLDNKNTDSTPHVLGFIKRLKKEIPDIKVETLDERFTSKIAKDSIILSGVNKKKRRDKSLVDKISATLILQTYLGI
ncbi:MAG: Holliday junction resolvase RuvX, partial [Cyclobacteriaceae bacterium]|nr:Holliday junction resolvase RuvX [Cyclobacteriaceae bacterium]